MSKRFTLDNVLDILAPLFIIEVFLFTNFLIIGFVKKKKWKKKLKTILTLIIYQKK